MNKMNLNPDSLIDKLPRCVWVTTPEGYRLGWCGDGYIYAAVRADSSVDKERAAWKTVWAGGQNMWAFRFENDPLVLDYLFSLIPAWFDQKLALKVLNTTDYKNLCDIQTDQDGRYVHFRNRRVATNQRDMLWLLDINDTIQDVRFDPGASLQYNNGESRFTGHPLQIWSDGIWTRGDLLSFSNYGGKTEINPDAAALIKSISKSLALQVGVEKLLNIQWCNKTEIAVIEGDQSGFCFRYSEEYRAEEWETAIGKFYMLFWEWGSYNGEGDSGDECDVFLTLAELKIAFKAKASLVKGLEG